MLLIDTFHLRNDFKGEYENYIVDFFYICLLNFFFKLKFILLIIFFSHQIVAFFEGNNGVREKLNFCLVPREQGTL